MLFGRPPITCPYCQYHGKAVKRAKARAIVQLFLLALTIVGFFFFIIPGLVFGLIFLIYSAQGYRFTCRKCKTPLGG